MKAKLTQTGKATVSHLDWVAAIVGLALIVAAVAMVYIPAAVGVAGLALLAAGLLVDLGGKD